MKRNLLVLAAILCLTATSATARKLTFLLSDPTFGIHPGSGQTDLSSRLQNAFESIRKQAGTNDEVIIKFERGTYEFHPADAAEREFYISNHDQNQPKRIGICLEHWNNLTLDGNGSDFVFHGRMLPLALTRSANCVLKNFSIDFAQPHIAQVEIVENDADKGITFRVAPWVNYRIGENGRFETFGEGWNMQPGSGIAFERESRHIVYGTGDISIDTRGLQATGAARTLIAPNWKDGRLKPGTVVAMRGWGRPAPAIFLDHDSNTTLRDVRVHYAEGMGLLAQRCTDISLKGFGVCLRGKEDPRYFTTQADATHFSQCRGKIVSTHGLYESMMDDAINIHGVYLKVRERMDDRTLRCGYEHHQAWGFEWGDAGDSVCFVRSKTMEETAGRNAIVSIRPADREEVKGTREFIIRFAHDLPAEINADEGYGIENLTWTPEILFSHNTVRNNRARGALFSSPRRTVCERNVFDHTSGTAILLCGDCNGWYESGACRDLVIRKNKFINALTSFYQFTNAVISIYPEIPDLKQQRTYFHGGKPGAIVIEDNRFDTFGTPLLYAKSVDGLVFRNNKVTKNTEYTPVLTDKEPIWLEYVKNTDIRE